MKHIIIRSFIAFLLVNIPFVSHAYAYFDANTGGYIVQVVIPMVFSAAVAITVFWRRLFGRLKNVINKLRRQNRIS